MAMCDECGSRQVVETEIEGLLVLSCQLCGHLQGDEAHLAEIEERREAADRGFDPAIYPLVKAIDQVPTFGVKTASAGRPGRTEYPFVFWRVQEGGLRDVERLLTCLEMANRTTKRRWVVELDLQRGLLFILRPRFWKAIVEITTEDILEARADLPHLARLIARDVKLGWWRG